MVSIVGSMVFSSSEFLLKSQKRRCYIFERFANPVDLGKRNSFFLKITPAVKFSVHGRYINDKFKRFKKL